MEAVQRHESSVATPFLGKRDDGTGLFGYADVFAMNHHTAEGRGNDHATGAVTGG
jgi:hypothetical protein